jgi:ribonucleotide monophosphatase NagD (HAD superfamily)
MEKEIILSTLPHTWILDIDGTLVKHNGYLTDEGDTLLDGAAEFLASIPEKDMIILLTARSSEFRNKTEEFLSKNNIRYDHIIFDAPVGERIIINDNKPSGLVTAYAIERTHDKWDKLTLIEK